MATWLVWAKAQAASNKGAKIFMARVSPWRPRPLARWGRETTRWLRIPRHGALGPRRAAPTLHARWHVGALRSRVRVGPTPRALRHSAAPLAGRAPGPRVQRASGRP